MRTKRRPTIMTMLLLTTVIAVQCAAQAEYIEFAMDNLDSAPFVIFPCFSVLSAVIVWVVMPLLIGLCLRSAQRMSAVCFAIGCIFSGMYLWGWPYLMTTGFVWLSQNILCGCGGFIDGPFICLDHVASLFWHF